MKELSDISVKISNEEYFNGPEMHHSTISTFDREGFACLATLFDTKESPSLTFGSAVDCLITDGQQAFDNEFVVSDCVISDKLNKAITTLWKTYGLAYNLRDIPTNAILSVYEEAELDSRTKDLHKRIAKIYEGQEYYNLLCNSSGKKIISSEVYNTVQRTVATLKESPETRNYFAPNDVFNADIKRYYQLKFKATLNNIEYAVMADELIVDYKHKIIVPIDLKTSSNKEYDFAKSFIHWGYSHQARLYWRVIRACLDKDDFFKDFELKDYLFIVINKESLHPVVWEYKDTKKEGSLFYGKNNQIEVRDPEEIAHELNSYIVNPTEVPSGIISGKNDLIVWLNKM